VRLTLHTKRLIRSSDYLEDGQSVGPGKDGYVFRYSGDYEATFRDFYRSSRSQHTTASMAVAVLVVKVPCLLCGRVFYPG